jgi:hypothetical protein
MPGKGKKKSGGGGGGGGDKTEAFWESIETENVKTLHWSLKYGGFSAKLPYDDDNTPPIHFCVQLEKLKSLKTIVESIDRMRSQRDIDFPWQDEDGLTPLMVASQQGWAQGARLLLENGADMKKKDFNGKTARDHAKKEDKKNILKLFDEWESDAPEETLTEAEKAKKAEILARNQEDAARRTAEQKAIEEASRAKEEQKDKAKEDMKKAATAAAWPEVKQALADAKRELRLTKTEDEDGTEIDSFVWKLTSLQVLHLKMKKEVLTALPPDLGALIALTELNISNNSLTKLPEEIKNLTLLKSLTADNNCLESLPEGLASCKKLEVASFVGNELSSLAPLEPITGTLVVLHVSQNKLESIDIPLDKCPRLNFLTASANQLVVVPKKIGACTKLKTLKLADNKLTELPAEISDCKDLQEIDVDGNPFKDKKIAKILSGGHNPVKDLKTYLGKNKKGKK